MFDLRSLLAAVVVATIPLAAVTGSPAKAAEAIRIGELNSYTGLPAFTLPYRQGWQLGLDEINAGGGVLGRPLEVISRDDGAKPGDAVTVTNELISKERVALVFGTLLSHVGLAVSDVAKQKKVVFIAAEPLSDTIAWSKGNRYTFRLRPGTYVQAAMLAEEAAKLPAKRWATVAPNYEYGKSAVAAFKQILSAKRPDIQWVGEQWPALFKLDAGPTVQALAKAGPDAIFNVTFGSDLTKLVREGKLRGLFDGREVASVLSGEPEWIDPLKDEAPKGWIVTGYPWYDIQTPAHTAFKDAYMAKFKDYPRLGSVVGYATIKAVAAAIAKAGSTDTEKLIAAFRGLKIGTPIGPITFRPADQQSTMGTYIGRLMVKDGMPRMVGWRFGDGADYLPSEAEAAKMRPAD
ncbi:MAG: ABC transporter substrate-binding protein [Rhodospirillales bacterium]|jgi:branched-chain amino acid transport system substrate-binding protein|nr:ABC transporter substrate-binding protein [Rhodospirillales bacterium]MDP6884408.1 ABC transporter substrate-binding protein [Rhodospirillales bacterium]